MAFNLAKEKEKNSKIIGSVLLHADDFINGVTKEVKTFLEGRGDADAAAQAEKVKSELGKLVDDYVEAVKKRPSAAG